MIEVAADEDDELPMRGTEGCTDVNPGGLVDDEEGTMGTDTVVGGVTVEVGGIGVEPAGIEGEVVDGTVLHEASLYESKKTKLESRRWQRY